MAPSKSICRLKEQKHREQEVSSIVFHTQAHCTVVLLSVWLIYAAFCYIVFLLSVGGNMNTAGC